MNNDDASSSGCPVGLTTVDMIEKIHKIVEIGSNSDSRDNWNVNMNIFPLQIVRDVCMRLMFILVL